jgi:hypothetical protein
VADANSATTVAINGAGIGGVYLAAHLGLAGFKLRLHDVADSRLADNRAMGGITVEGDAGGMPQSSTSRPIFAQPSTAPTSSLS